MGKFGSIQDKNSPGTNDGFRCDIYGDDVDGHGRPTRRRMSLKGALRTVQEVCMDGLREMNRGGFSYDERPLYYSPDEIYQCFDTIDQALHATQDESAFYRIKFDELETENKKMRKAIEGSSSGNATLHAFKMEREHKAELEKLEMNLVKEHEKVEKAQEELKLTQVALEAKDKLVASITVERDMAIRTSQQEKSQREAVTTQHLITHNEKRAAEKARDEALLAIGQYSMDNAALKAEIDRLTPKTEPGKTGRKLDL